MSSVFSAGQGRKQMSSAIADKQISAAGASPTFEGLKRNAASTRAESHRATFRVRVEAGIGMPV